MAKINSSTLARASSPSFVSPPIGQRFSSWGLAWTAAGRGRWEMNGEIIDSAELYRRQAAAKR